jgi:uncharacterized protein YcbK (DUF882 family)
VKIKQGKALRAFSKPAAAERRAMAMMTDQEWKSIKYFSPSEKWGDPYKMDFQLVAGLDKLRQYVGRRIVIHCGYEKRATGGYHPMGRAVDLHIEGLHPMEQYIAATRFQCFKGIGVYLWWNNPGLHLDNRLLKAFETRAMWGSMEEKKYVKIDRNFIIKAMQIETA